MLGKNEDVAELELSLKHAHTDNVVAKREAKKLLRQAPPTNPSHNPSPNPKPNPTRLHSIESDIAKAEASQAKSDRDTDNQKVILLHPIFNVYNLTSIIVQLLPLKGKRKASLLEQKILEQDEVIQSLKLVIEVAAEEQRAFLHRFKKEVRQHTVDTQDAVEDASKARDDLAIVQKKTATRIKSLEREVLNKVKDNMDMKTVVEGQLETMEASQRDLATRTRILAVQQDDLQKQQAASASQVSSLAFHRDRHKTARKKMKTSHSKNLLLEQETREREKQVKINPEASFFFRVRVSSRFFCCMIR